MAERRGSAAETRGGQGAGPRGPMSRPGSGGRFGEISRAKDARGTLRRLVGYVGAQRATLLGTVGLVIVTSLLGLAGPYLLGRAIDTHIPSQDLQALARLAGLMMGLYVVDAGAVWLQSYLMAAVAQYTVRDLRRDLFGHLQDLPLRFFDQRPHGELMSRLTNDVENVSHILASGTAQLIASVAMLLGVLVVMFVMNWQMALVTIAVVPLSVALTRFIAPRTRAGFREQQANLGILNGIIEETITGEKIVQAYVREERTIAEFDEANAALRRAATRAQILAGIMGPSMNMINNISLAIVAAVGGVFALQGIATVGVIAAFISYARQFSRPLNQLAQLYNAIQSALAGAERVFQVIDEDPEPPDAPEALALERAEGAVAFRDVSFAYEEGVPVLRDVSLESAPGQMIALVGPTGAGKTTIINLLTRFYDIDEGAVCVDGHDIRTVRRDDLRQRIGLVLQDNFLFGATVMENIRYGRLDATDEEVIAAARTANADHFVRRLPDGYQTTLSERGANLSQGQRQLLAIARAVLADPDILILDEATSNVDTRTEQHLQEALRRLMAGRTSFVIAHRLSTIREADQVLVIHGGEVIERGTHEELLAAGGFYHDLYYSQFRGEVEPVAER
jgi:ATP-binding cassette subfamily B multidrug efflux pump